jgi:restriction system protein
VLAPDPRFEEIDRLTGVQFEEAVVELLELLGFQSVKRTEYYDKGADIVCALDGKRIAVQVKRQNSVVGVDAVRQVIDGTRQYGCDRAIVVTNSFFTEKATESARLWNVELWDRRRLAEYVDGDPLDSDPRTCAFCRAPVSDGVREWCLTHPGRFAGNIYCRRHQSRRSRRVDRE